MTIKLLVVEDGEGPAEVPKQRETIGSQTSMSSALRVDLETEMEVEAEEDDEGMPTLTKYLRGFSLPGAMEVAASDRRGRKNKLGTLLGVYLPTIQHIFGVIMFIRLPWVVGSAGILQAFILVFSCCMCTFLTCLSMSAIATNGVVMSGGSYFMISRSLGVELGTAIGIIFYLGNTFASGMYIIGGCEILLDSLSHDLPRLPGHDSASGFASPKFNNFRLYGMGLLLFLVLVNCAGVRVVQLFAPVSLLCVILSVISIFVGSIVPQSEKICLVNNQYALAYSRKEKGMSLVDYCRTQTINCTSCNMSIAESTLRWSGRRFAENVKPMYLATDHPRPSMFDYNKYKIVQQNVATTFFTLLAVYFPSVTGIMTGANMSGDLINPQQSIPIGTIAAQLTTTLVYIMFVFIYGSTMHRQVLLDKYGISMGGRMPTSTLSFPTKWIVMVGSFTSTFGAALQCICSAPRLLQSIAKDNVIPFAWFFQKTTSRGEPLCALLATSLLALVIVLIGSVEEIAPLLDFFFLVCYAFVNVVVAVQSIVQSPNWRPRFRFFHWSLSLLGAALCLFIMFATYWYYAVGTLVILAALYILVRLLGAKKEWGDSVNGLVLQTALYCLLHVRDGEVHTKIWRPHVLALIQYSDVEPVGPKKQHMFSFMKHMQESKILIIVGNLIRGDLLNAELRELAETRRRAMLMQMLQARIRGFVKCVISNTLHDGLNTMVQSAGVGKLSINTVLVAWPLDWQMHGENERHMAFMDAVYRVATTDKSLLVLKSSEDTYPTRALSATHTIDVWWVIHDGGLLVLLPVLLKKCRVWRDCSVRVFAVAYEGEDQDALHEKLKKWFYDIRIDVEILIVPVDSETLKIYLKNGNQEKRFEDLQRECDSNVPRQPQMIRYESKLSGASVESLKAPTAATGSKVDSTFTFTPGSDLAKQLKKEIEAELKVTADNAPKKSNLKMSSRNTSPEPSAVNSPRKSVHMLDEVMTKSRENAAHFRDLIHERSQNAMLTIINLPPPPRGREGLPNYFTYLDTLTEQLQNVLFVRGTGREVVTMES